VERRLATVTLALLVAASAAACSHGESGKSGSLAPPPGKDSIGVPVQIGKAFSDGMLAARNHGSEPAVLDRASFVRPDSGLEYLGAYVLSMPLRCWSVRRMPAPHVCLFYTWKDKRGAVHSSRRSSGGFVAGFGKPRDGHALSGFTVVPGAGVVVVLGIKVTKPGRHRFEALALDYHVGGKAFRDIYSSSGQLCAPKQRYIDNCHALLDQEHSTDSK
jgi:hypothetical protein